MAQTISIRTEDDDSLLSQKYGNLNFIKDKTILYEFLNIKEINKNPEISSFIIYPFGCNESQKKAIKTSLEYSISLIEGPPGTGKTQTILNLISNLLIDKKTIAVVSNNNSAVENVFNKLKDNNLDYLVAFLGKKDNKKKFIENQKYRKLPKGKVFKEDEIKKLKNKIINLNKELDLSFKKNIELSEVSEKLNNLKLEFEYFKKSHNEFFRKKNGNNHCDIKLKLSRDQIIKLLINQKKLLNKKTSSKVLFFPKMFFNKIKIIFIWNKK